MLPTVYAVSESAVPRSLLLRKFGLCVHNISDITVQH